MTNEEIISELERLRDAAIYVNIDVAAIANVVARMLQANDPLERVTSAVLIAEGRPIQKPSRGLRRRRRRRRS
jgi:hypothetical protein